MRSYLLRDVPGTTPHRISHRFRAVLRRQSVKAVLKGALFGLEIINDLTPGLRLTSRRRLPRTMSAGILGAEVATWAAVSPSLLPRPWWVTAANVAIGQGTGHAVASGIAWGMRRAILEAGHLPAEIWRPRVRQITHATMTAVTTAVMFQSLRRQARQTAKLPTEYGRGPAHALAGATVGTIGYGALLIAGEATQQAIDHLSTQFDRFLPRLLAMPVSMLAFASAVYLLSDQVVLRHILQRMSRDAEKVNQAVFAGSSMPYERQRSGSPASFESWTTLGSQGRAMVSMGPRKSTIAELTGIDRVREPIRIYIGLVEGRSREQAVRQLLAEMDRTGAFERKVLVIHVGSGSGWVTDWSLSSVEFLTGGDCASVAMQYSYLPSALAYVLERESPVASSRVLIDTIVDRLETMPPEQRPKLYVAGESLGAYGILSAFDSLEELSKRVDGALFSGPPRVTQLTARLARTRDAGSLERLPVIEGGRHIRYAATADHLHHDAFGKSYAHQWQHPRMVIAQHASDPIVFWNSRLAWTRPGWLAEPGSRGVPAPAWQYCDVISEVRWFPFITFWQIGLDQLNCLNVPGGHGHNYHEDMLFYWQGILDQAAVINLDEDLAAKLSGFLHANAIQR